MDNEKNTAKLEQMLLNYMMETPNSQFRHPKIVVYLIDHEDTYKEIKKVFQEY